MGNRRWDWRGGGAGGVRAPPERARTPPGGGRVNKSLVAALRTHGQSAMGLAGGDGNVFRARKKKTVPDLGFVGEIAATDPLWLEAIWKMDAVPVISSIALGFDGEYYNINADE